MVGTWSAGDLQDAHGKATEPAVLLGVLDGHGDYGREAAALAARVLPQALADSEAFRVSSRTAAAALVCAMGRCPGWAAAPSRCLSASDRTVLGWANLRCQGDCSHSDVVLQYYRLLFQSCADDLNAS